MTISPQGDKHLHLRANLGEGNFQKMSSFPAFTKWEGRALKVRINGANLTYIHNNWPKAEWVGGANDIKVKFLNHIGAASAALEAKETGSVLPEDDHTYKRPPMDHQRKAFLVSRDKPAYAYLMEQGTGKTKVVLDNAAWLYNKGKIDMLVIVAWPNGVHRNWIDYELPADLPVAYEAAFWNSKRTKKKLAEYDAVHSSKGVLKVMSFNVEAFVSGNAQEEILRCLKHNRCMMVIDQSACIKNPSAKRTKFLIDEVSDLAPYKRILDGDPVAEGADELYSQFKFLDPWIIGHDTWTGFKSEYCIEKSFGKGSAVVGYKNFDQLRELIDPFCYRALAKDCLDLPPRIYKMWEFDMSPKEKRHFEELRKKDLTFFEGDLAANMDELDLDEDLPDHLEESLALVKNMRLQQISSGWWPEKDNFKSIDKTPSRLLALEQLLKANTGKALIFSRFRADLEAIQELLGDKAVSYHGGVSEDDRAIAKKRFQEDPDTLYFIGQPRNAGIGHTLTAAKHVIFYSNDPSLRLRAESEKRAHRKGLKDDLIIWDLVARDSLDYKTMNSLRKKRNVSNMILQDPANFFLCHE